MAQNEFAQFKEKQEELANIISETSVIMNDLSLSKFAERLQQLAAQVGNDSFKIQIVGTFKNGKSTFINALLGEDILPSKATPCTAVINEVKYGDKKSAILTFREIMPEKLLDCIPEPTLNHMKAHGMNHIPPMEINPDRMQDYVTIPLDGDKDEISKASPYRSVELYYPSLLLKDGVEIIDSPGLNENNERTRVTLEYLDRADAIIFLLNATQLCSQDEMGMIQDILIPKGFNDMFFVVNRFDCIPKKEKEDIIKLAQKYVGHLTSNELFFVSARKAVDGKTGRDEEGDELSEEERVKAIEKSGIDPFDLRLREFLTKDKGRIKLTRPARELNTMISTETLHTTIPQQRKMLTTDYKTLEKRYQDAKPKLELLEDQKRELYTQMKLRVEASRNEIRRAVSRYYKKIATEVPKWVNSYNPKNEPGLGTKAKIEACTKEISQFVSDKLQSDFADWRKTSLQDLAEEKSKYIFDSTEAKLGDFLKYLDEISGEIAGENKSEIKNVKPWERIAGAGLMLFMGASSGASVMAGGFDSKIFVKNLAVDIGVGVGAAIIGLANPIIGLVILSGLIYNGVIQGKKATLQRVKDGVSETIVNSIIDGEDAKAELIANEIGSKLMDIVDTTINVLDEQIADVKGQVETILKEVKEGHSRIENRMKLLNESEKKLQQLSGRLDDLIFELAETK